MLFISLSQLILNPVVTRLGYPNLQLQYTASNDSNDAFHNTEVADTAYAATDSNKFNNPAKLGTFGFDISSLFKTDKHAFQLLKSVYLRKRINFNAMWTISSSQNLINKLVSPDIRAFKIYDEIRLLSGASDDPEDKRIFAFTLCEDCTKRSKKK